MLRRTKPPTCRSPRIRADRTALNNVGTVPARQQAPDRSGAMLAILAHARVRGDPPLPGWQRPTLVAFLSPLFLLVERNGLIPTPHALPERLVRGHAARSTTTHLLAVTHVKVPGNSWLTGTSCGVSRCSLKTRSAGSSASTISVPVGVHGSLPANPRCPRELYDLFAENPFWTTSGLISQGWGSRSRPHQRAIGRLESVGVISLAWPARRNRMSLRAGTPRDIARAIAVYPRHEQGD